MSAIFTSHARNASESATNRITLLAADTLVTVDAVAVTAVKHNAQLSKSAVTATIIDRKTIEQRGIGGVKDIVTAAPNFFMPDYGSRMTSSV